MMRWGRFGYFWFLTRLMTDGSWLIDRDWYGLAAEIVQVSKCRLVTAQHDKRSVVPVAAASHQSSTKSHSTKPTLSTKVVRSDTQSHVTLEPPHTLGGQDMQSDRIVFGKLSEEGFCNQPLLRRSSTWRRRFEWRNGLGCKNSYHRDSHNTRI